MVCTTRTRRTWSEAAHAACLQHEALVNLALSDVDLTMMCTYDSSALPQHALADSYYTHPLLIDGRSEPTPSPVYAEADLARHYFLPLPPPPPGSMRLAFGVDDLHAVRELVATRASSAGTDSECSANLQLAATEAATNAILHGGAGGCCSCGARTIRWSASSSRTLRCPRRWPAAARSR